KVEPRLGVDVVEAFEQGIARRALPQAPDRERQVLPDLGVVARVAEERAEVASEPRVLQAVLLVQVLRQLERRLPAAVPVARLDFVEVIPGRARLSGDQPEQDEDADAETRTARDY